MITACGYWRANRRSSCSERRQLWRSSGRGRLGRVAELADRVDRVAADHQVAVAKPADHRLVAGAVAGRGGEPDAAVAEQVEGAAEGRVRADALGAVAERAVVEGVVVVGRAVAAQEGPAVGGRGDPLGLGEHEGRARELRDPGAVVEVQVGHHDQADRLRVDAARAELRGEVVPGIERRPGRSSRPGAPGSRPASSRPRGAARCRRGTVPPSGWLIRKAGIGSPSHCERGVPIPIMRGTASRPSPSRKPRGACISPAEQRLDGDGRPLAPPGSGAVSGLVSARTFIAAEP